jgi:hypothetical protein
LSGLSNEGEYRRLLLSSLAAQTGSYVSFTFPVTEIKFIYMCWKCNVAQATRDKISGLRKTRDVERMKRTPRAHVPFK